MEEFGFGALAQRITWTKVRLRNGELSMERLTLQRVAPVVTLEGHRHPNKAHFREGLELKV
jgi:hypothetical protein